jgi:hypothetical protein
MKYTFPYTTHQNSQQAGIFGRDIYKYADGMMWLNDTQTFTTRLEISYE